eukprot:8848745-Pyramimonas_sp.AAC.1
MATGDVHGNLDRLRTELRYIRYPLELDVTGAREGNPAVLLPVLHYVILGFSKHVARFIADKGYELMAKADLRFVEGISKMLLNEFNYRAKLSPHQFLSQAYAERKLLFLHDVIQICKRKHNELFRQKKQAQVVVKSSVYERLSQGNTARARSTSPSKGGTLLHGASRPNSKEVKVEVVSGSRVSSQVMRVQHTGMPNGSMLAARPMTAPQPTASAQDEDWAAIREGNQSWETADRWDLVPADLAWAHEEPLRQLPPPPTDPLDLATGPVCQESSERPCEGQESEEDYGDHDHQWAGEEERCEEGKAGDCEAEALQEKAERLQHLLAESEAVRAEQAARLEALESRMKFLEGQLLKRDEAAATVPAPVPAGRPSARPWGCLLYTSDAADDTPC